MKCNPWRWIWGLVPLAILGWATLFVERDRIERDLTQRAQAALLSAGVDWAQPGFAGRDAVLSGVAADEQGPGKAAAALRNVWGVRVVDTNTQLIPKVDNYSWLAQRQGARIILRGNVPSEAARQAVLGVARASFPGLEISDKTELARGVPSADAWLAGVGFGLKQLAGLKQGEARLDGVALSVAGEGRDLASYRAVKTALASDMPRGVRLADDRVTPPAVSPFTWNAKAQGNQLTLTGYVPSEAAREEIFAAAKAAFPRAAVVDRMETAAGAPAGWNGAAVVAIRELGRLDEGSAETRDTQVLVAGLARDEAAAETVRRGLREGLAKTFRLTDQIRAREPAPGPRAAAPYVTSAVVDATTVVLTGMAPNEAARTAAQQAAATRFPGRRIDNRLEIMAGAPDGWQRCFEGGLAGLARLGGGQAQMSDRRLELAGSTDDDTLVTSVPAELARGTSGVCDTSARIALQTTPEPDLDWRAKFAGREVVLSGDVPSASVKSELVQSATRLFRDAAIVDRMRVVESRSRKWPLAAEQGLRMLARLTSGEARLQRQQLTVSGLARDQLTATQVRDQIGRELPAGYAGRETIEVRQAAAAPTPAPTPAADPRVVAAKTCQDALKAAVRDGTIRFQRASAELSEESFPTLDKLAGVAKTCPELAIEIEGHTDSEGTPERNQRLSDRRAKSVAAYLTKAGIDAGRLNATGQGETRPIAPNDTPEGRAINRRIEFLVRAK